MSRSTVMTGTKEVGAGEADFASRVRREGGGRKANIDMDPNLLLELDDLVAPRLGATRCLRCAGHASRPTASAGRLARRASRRARPSSANCSTTWALASKPRPRRTKARSTRTRRAVPLHQRHLRRVSDRRPAGDQRRREEVGARRRRGLGLARRRHGHGGPCPPSAARGPRWDGPATPIQALLQRLTRTWGPFPWRCAPLTMSWQGIALPSPGAGPRRAVRAPCWELNGTSAWCTGGVGDDASEQLFRGAPPGT